MKSFLSILLLAITCSFVNAQRLGYLKEVAGGFVHTSYNSSEGHKLSGTSLDMRINYSILGNIIFRNSDSRFMIGDHIGAGFGMGYFKKTGDDFPLMMSLNLEFGVKSSFAINEKMEVGVKYLLGAANYFSDLKNDFGLSQKPSIIPSVRYEKLMGSVGFGTARVGDGGKGDKGKFIMLEGRYLLGDVDDSNGFLFLRA